MIEILLLVHSGKQWQSKWVYGCTDILKDIRLFHRTELQSTQKHFYQISIAFYSHSIIARVSGISTSQFLVPTLTRLLVHFYFALTKDISWPPVTSLFPVAKTGSHKVDAEASWGINVYSPQCLLETPSNSRRLSYVDCELSDLCNLAPASISRTSWGTHTALPICNSSLRPQKGGSWTQASSIVHNGCAFAFTVHKRFSHISGIEQDLDFQRKIKEFMFVPSMLPG